VDPSTFKVKEELSRMVKLDIIKKVEGPSGVVPVLLSQSEFVLT